jgi:ABC-type uncharacterized transport system auxiliary subunit
MLAQSRRAAAGSIALLALVLAACVSVDVGAGKVPALKRYVLNDARAAASANSRRDGPLLLLQVLPADPLADSEAIAYAREPGERNVYQLATWTDKPTRRLALLVQQRLEARGTLGGVAQLGQPLKADWLLALAIESIVHRVDSAEVELAVRAELIHRGERRRVALHRFVTRAPVAQADAAAAVRGFNAAVAAFLDELGPWTEASLASLARS